MQKIQPREQPKVIVWSYFSPECTKSFISDQRKMFKRNQYLNTIKIWLDIQDVVSKVH